MFYSKKYRRSNIATVKMEQVTGVGPAETSLGSWRHTDRRHLQ